MVENATFACSGAAAGGPGLAETVGAPGAGGCEACNSGARGTLASTPTTTTSEICSIQAVPVVNPGTADLMKFGTIYTT